MAEREHESPRDDETGGGGERRLSRLADYEVDEGYPDIRGWAVRGSNGRELGIVGELLVDTDLLEVSAVELHLGVGAAAVRGNVLGTTRVPIESVQIRPDRYVIVDVGAIPCEDVVALDADGAIMPRVPCGQIGIRRRGGPGAGTSPLRRRESDERPRP